MARFELSGKVALVTGGARGIGEATARELIARGASVTIVDLRPEHVERTAAALHDTKAMGLAADVTDRGAMQRAVATTVERFGGLDVVVANAGISPTSASMRAMATENFERVLDVNLHGVVRTVDAALPQIVERQGHVVVIASVMAFANGSGAIPYAMSKAAVEALGRGLRVELAQHGASASTAYFGFIDTEMVHRAVDADPQAERIFKGIPAPLRKRIPPATAGAAIVAGIEARAPRIIEPKRWKLVFALRGVLMPLIDARMESDANTQAIMRAVDARGDDEQPTTA